MSGRRDRLDRIRELWSTLITHARKGKNGDLRLNQEETIKAKADFKLKFGVSENTVLDYLSVLYHTGAYKRNDEEIAKWQKTNEGFLEKDNHTGYIDWILKNPEPECCWVLNIGFNIPDNVS